MPYDYSKLPRCNGQAGCPGHLGKFSDCLTEALWQTTLDGTDESTGSVEFQGYFSLLVLAETEEITIDPDGEARTVNAPAGNYIVENAESGAIYLHTYETEAEAREAFGVVDAAYGEWLEANEDV